MMAVKRKLGGKAVVFVPREGLDSNARHDVALITGSDGCCLEKGSGATPLTKSELQEGCGVDLSDAETLHVNANASIAVSSVNDACNGFKTASVLKF